MLHSEAFNTWEGLGDWEDIELNFPTITDTDPQASFKRPGTIGQRKPRKQQLESHKKARKRTRLDSEFSNADSIRSSLSGMGAAEMTPTLGVRQRMLNEMIQWIRADHHSIDNDVCMTCKVEHCFAMESMGAMPRDYFGGK